MTGALASSPGIPPPLDNDDDDVAWALQTAAVQWKREGYADAVVWLRRAVDSARQAGLEWRAIELEAAATHLTDTMLAHASEQAPLPPSGQELHGGDVDDLLQSVPPPEPESPKPLPSSVDVDFDDEPTPLRMPPPPSAMKSKAPPRVSAPPPIEPAPASVSAVLIDEAPASVSAVLIDEAPASVSAVLIDEAPASVSAVLLPQPPSLERPVTVDRTPTPQPAAEPTEAPGEPDPAPAMSLEDARGLQDLPEEAQLELAASARLVKLEREEDVSSFAVAFVVAGSVDIMAAIADVACAHAGVGEVVFTDGTLAEGIALRVVASADATTVAVWDREAIDKATADCPWVADDLRAVADRFQALAGAAMGALGERFDDALRASVTDRCEVRTFLPGDPIVERGKSVPGLYIVGAGRVEITEDDGAEPSDELGPGDFLFSAHVLSASPAAATARAGKGGALLLFAERHAAHELMVSVPPLLEILAG